LAARRCAKGKARRPDISEQGYGLVELLVAVLLVIVILWVLLALVGR
jgi:competence protein ComGC